MKVAQFKRRHLKEEEETSKIQNYKTSANSDIFAFLFIISCKILFISHHIFNVAIISLELTQPVIDRQIMAHLFAKLIHRQSDAMVAV